MPPHRALALLLALPVLSAAAPAPAAEAPPRRAVLRLAYAGPAASPVHAGAVHFKEAFEQAMAGRAEVQLLPPGGEGDEPAMLAELRRGAVQLAILGSGAQVGPAAQFTALPFLFRDPAHRRQVAEGAAGRLLARRIAEQSSLAVLAFFAGPENVVATAAGPVTRPADLRGMPFRVAVYPMLIEGVRGLGALPVPLPPPLTVPAVRQRMVAGGQMDLQTALDLQVYEVLPYMSLPSTPFAAELYPVLADRRAVAALPQEVQQTLVETLQGVARRRFEVGEEATARAQRELEARGVKFAPLDQAAFREAMRPFRETAARLLKVQDLLAGIDRTR